MPNTHSDASQPEDSPMEVVVIDDDVIIEEDVCIEEDEDIDDQEEKPNKNPQGSRKNLGKT